MTDRVLKRLWNLEVLLHVADFYIGVSLLFVAASAACDMNMLESKSASLLRGV